MKLRRPSVMIGAALATMHLLLLLYSIYLMEFARRPGGDDPTTWIWMIWGIVDFPVTILVFLLWGLLFALVPESSSNFHQLHQLMPMLVHGIAGTAWWFLIPVVLGRMKK